MKKIYFLLCLILTISFIGCDCGCGLNVDGAKIEYINTESKFLITLENEDQFYGNMDKWYEYPGGEEVYVQGTRNDNLNTLIISNKIQNEVNTFNNKNIEKEVKKEQNKEIKTNITPIN